MPLISSSMQLVINSYDAIFKIFYYNKMYCCKLRKYSLQATHIFFTSTHQRHLSTVQKSVCRLHTYPVRHLQHFYVFYNLYQMNGSNIKWRKSHIQGGNCFLYDCHIDCAVTLSHLCFCMTLCLCQVPTLYIKMGLEFSMFFRKKQN